MASSGGIKPLDPPSPSLFDVFYEELLTQMMENGGELNEKIPQEFMELTTDIQRVEFLLQNWSVVRDLRIKNRQNLKSFEKSTKFREGNHLSIELAGLWGRRKDDFSFLSSECFS